MIYRSDPILIKLSSSVAIIWPPIWKYCSPPFQWML